MPSFLKNTSGGKAISGGSLSPRSRRGNNSDQVVSYWAGGVGVPTVSLPILATATSANAGFTVVISNFDASLLYTISTSAGSVARTTSTITVSGLAASASATITVVASKSGFVTAAPVSKSGTAAAACTCVFQYTSVEGGNCCCTGMCGAANQVCCYDIYVYAPASSPCTGSCSNSVGGWYACDGTC